MPRITFEAPAFTFALTDYDFAMLLEAQFVSGQTLVYHRGHLGGERPGADPKRVQRTMGKKVVGPAVHGEFEAVVWIQARTFCLYVQRPVRILAGDTNAVVRIDTLVEFARAIGVRSTSGWAGPVW